MGGSKAITPGIYEPLRDLPGRQSVAMQESSIVPLGAFILCVKTVPRPVAR